MKYNLTFISDTHSRHNDISSNLIGGDIIFHTGDISTVGGKHEIFDFLDWYGNLKLYTYKILIAGNHDIGFEEDCQWYSKYASDKGIIYLHDSSIEIMGIKIYGSPWQPEYRNWAFNLPRMGDELFEKWNLIPNDVDILLTHCPPNGILDYVYRNSFFAGCEYLNFKVNEVNPKIHAFGHVHSGYGYTYRNNTNFINSSIMNDLYVPSNQPVHGIWDMDENNLNFIR